MVRGMLLGAAAMVTTAVPATARNAQAVAFGAREDIQQISLSPDGKQVAYVTPGPDQGVAVLVASIEGNTAGKVVMTASGKPDRLFGCHWASDARIVCQVGLLDRSTGIDLTFSRMVAVNADGGDIQLLSAPENSRELGFHQSGGGIIDWLADDPGKVLMTRTFVPERSIGTNLHSDKQGLGVEKVDTVSLRRTIIEQPVRGGIEFITDGEGTIRIMGRQQGTASGYLPDTINYFYRRPASREWKPLSDYNVLAHTGFNPYAVDSWSNVAYGFGDEGGRQALLRIALDGSMRREVVLARRDVDVDDLIMIGRTRRVVGAGYATDHRQVIFFDPELKALAASLTKALPGLPLVRFVDASADEQRLLLFAGSDRDPGRYYVYDKPKRHLSEVLLARAALENMQLANVKAVTFPAADGTAIPAYLTLPPGGGGKDLPAIVMPHGGPAARDEWGFDWLSQFFVARGFAVIQPNFRGSSGYGEAWFQKNGFQSWRTAIGDVNDAGRWLVKQGIAAPEKLATVGWSYGGYAALQSAVVDPGLFKAIVAIAPVTDLVTLKSEARNYANFALVDSYIGSGPHLVEGSPAANAARITAPVLLFHGTLDQNVGVGESKLMAARLRDAGRKPGLVIFDGLDHQLNDSAARARMLDEADTFLRTSMGIGAAK